ncbi:hypothetical protein AOLI_G00299540 [Acnodon oligacanthus]
MRRLAAPQLGPTVRYGSAAREAQLSLLGNGGKILTVERKRNPHSSGGVGESRGGQEEAQTLTDHYSYYS